MEYPTLNTVSASREMLSTFAGYNHNLRAKDNEFFEMQNMTSSYYPVLSPRAKRFSSNELITDFKGMTAKDAPIYVSGSKLYFNGYDIDLELTDTPKTLISMGAYLLVFPDQKYVNTVDITDYGSLSNRQSVTKFRDEITGEYEWGQEISLSMCNLSSLSEDGNYEASETEPEKPANGQYWLDTSGANAVLKQYSSSASMWTQVATTFVKLNAVGIGKGFKQWDGVNVSGLTGDAAKFNGTQLVYAVGDNYIVFVGIIKDRIVLTDDETFTGVTVERKVPDCDFYTESENRIWGCKYGMVDGRAVNEIYACALGDPWNWNQFRGIAGDSYAVSLGSDGEFTGAATHGGYPIFFKDTCIHKIYGNLPSNYQVLTTNCRGVQKGSHNSVVLVNETLYYKSALDICAYDGTLPTSISKALGDVRYSDAVAGAFENKYYISMKDEEGIWHLFVYDTAKGMWHREDNTHALAFATVRNNFYWYDADKNKLISTTIGETTEGDVIWSAESDIEWSVETGVMGYELPDNKYNSRFNIRMMLEEGASADIYLQYDSNGIWEHKGHLAGTRLRSFTLPIIPRRCDHMRMKLSGKGGCKIFSITKIIEQGSDT